MAANEKLEAFLASEAGDNKPATEPQAPAEPAKPSDAPAKPSEPVATPEPAQDDDDDAPVREARFGEPSVPQAALIDERAKRHQWREEAARYKAQAEEREKHAAELAKRIEALEQQRQAPPQPQYQPEPAFQWADPQTDPVTWTQQQLMNQNFNFSERMMRKEIGHEAVDKLIADFRDLTRSDPTLMQRVRMEADPFDWARRQVENHRVLSEMGNDPTSYEQKLRAKWEAEQAAKAPAVQLPQNTPPPNMPPSLATVRSAAPRGAPQWSGPLSDQQFAVDMRERRMAQRRG